MQANKKVSDTLRRDFPTRISITSARNRCNRLVAIGPRLLFLATYNPAEIVIQSQEIDRGADSSEITVLDGRWIHP